MVTGVGPMKEHDYPIDDRPVDQNKRRLLKFSLSRRGTLASIVGLGGWTLLGSDVTRAKSGNSRQGPRPRGWNQDVDAQGHELFNLDSLAMRSNSSKISDFEGSNLSIDAGVLNATDTRTNVSDDGDLIVPEASDINFAANLGVSDDGDGSVTVNATGLSLWEDIDEDSLLEASAYNGVDVDQVDAGFVEAPEFGTKADTPLLLIVNGERAFFIEPTSGVAGANIVGGHPSNSVGSDVWGATISGGGYDDGTDGRPNTVSSNFGTVGGGFGNRVHAVNSTIGGGGRNTATGSSATIGGGISNEADGSRSSVGGGQGNQAKSSFTTVSGGTGNLAEGESTTVAGGQSNEARGQESTVGGGLSNEAAAPQSFVGGGINNEANGDRATIGGGIGNTAGIDRADEGATVAGGIENEALEEGSVIGGGSSNQALGRDCTVAGGRDNVATSRLSSVGGGEQNRASAAYATVPGGADNLAIRKYSFAAGRNATADSSGAFVWADSSDFEFRADGLNSWNVRATGGAKFVSGIDSNGTPTAGVELAPGDGSWSALSARSAKEHIHSVHPREILSRVEALDISSWSYKSQDEEVRHIGPMAEDFYEAFEFGASRDRITSVDADGVALAAIQGLGEKIEEKDEQIASLKEENDALQNRLEEIEARIETLEEGSGTVTVD